MIRRLGRYTAKADEDICFVRADGEPEPVMYAAPKAEAIQIATAVLLAVHPDVHAEEGDTCWVSHEVITTPERNGWQPVFSVLPWGVDETGRRVPVKSVNINWAGGIFEGDEGIAQARAYAIAILLACALAEEEYRKNTEAMLLKGEQP